MNIEVEALKTAKKPKSINKVIQEHFESIDKGNFNVASFKADLNALSSEDVDCRKSVKTLMKLTKESVTGDANSKIVTNVEKMTDMLIEKFTIKKPNLCEVLFFPSVENEAKIVEHLKAAKKTIYVAMFTITNEHMCSALLEAYFRGVDVKILTDDDELRIMGNYVRDLAEEGVSVRTDASSKALMHNKFAVIDHCTLITGSYNWTVRATKANLENVIIVDNQDMVTTFATEFNKLWGDYSDHVVGSMTGKQKLKTKLYQKYQEGLAKLEKQKQKLEAKHDAKHDVKKHVKHDEEEDSGVVPQSKKISKAPKETAPKHTTKHLKKGAHHEEDEDGPVEEKAASSSGFVKSLFNMFRKITK